MKVVKFGGTSLANADQFKKVANIIMSDKERKIIIVSAPGKRHDHDYKMTDLLIHLGEAFFNNEKFKSYYITIVHRFSRIIEKLNLSTKLLDEIEEKIQHVMENEQNEKEKLDCFKAIGEDSSAKILSAYLQTLGVNANYVNPMDAGIIVEQTPMGTQILKQSYEKIYKLNQSNSISIIPGFFGYTKSGHLATFPRGGSDITGAIVAAGVKASLYENFTDVDSVYAVNPNIVENPKQISSLTYREMRELSYAGFSVFHDEALIPAFEANIPVCIKNTNNPDAKGTMIVAKKEPNDYTVVGIASDTGFSSIYVSKYLMNREVGFGRKLFQILEEENVSFEHAPSGIDDISIIIRDHQLKNGVEENVMNRIKTELKADTVSIIRNLALIMIVGERMKETIGMAEKATIALSKAKVNIEMINQGSSEVSMMFGIKANGLHRAIKALYEEYFLK